MNKTNMLIAMLLLVSLISAFPYTPPSSYNIYSIFGYNFTVATIGAPITVPYNISMGIGTLTSPTGNAGYMNWTPEFGIIGGDNTGGGAGTIQLANIPMPQDGLNHTGYYSQQSGVSTDTTVYCNATVAFAVPASTAASGRWYINTTDGGNTYYINTSVTAYGSTICSNTGNITISVRASNLINSVNYPLYNHASGVELTLPDAATRDNTINGSLRTNSYGAIDYVLRSDMPLSYPQDFNTTGYARSMKALIYYNSQIIKPLITYFPVLNLAYPNLYDQTSNVAFLRNNTVAYVLDSVTQNWYAIPAYASYDGSNTTIYALSALYYPSTSQSAPLNVTLMYLVKDCYTNGKNFTWNIQAPSSQTFTQLYIYTDGTGKSVSSTGLSYSGTNDTTYISNITINAGTQLLCAWDNQTSALVPNFPLLQSYNVTKTFGTLVLVTTIGMTAVNPVAGAAAFMVNDMFQILNAAQMFSIFGMAAVVSMIINFKGERTLKSLGIYIVIGLVFLANYYVIGIAGGISSMAAEQSQLTAFSSSFNAMSSSLDTGNLWSFAVSATSVMINFGQFVLLLPAIIANALFNAISAINFNLFNAVKGFKDVIVIGVYLVLVFKLYEILANKFLKI